MFQHGLLAHWKRGPDGLNIASMNTVYHHHHHHHHHLGWYICSHHHNKSNSQLKAIIYFMKFF